MKNKSFTLIELLVVIAIIGLLVIIIAIPINRARQVASIARTLQYEASLHRYLGSDIVGWWKFDGDLTDISGYNNHGSCTSCPDVVDGVSGKEGNALNFDGSSDYVTMGNVLNLMGDRTISFWVKSTNLFPSDSHAAFVSKWRGGERNFIFWAHSTNNSIRWGDTSSSRLVWNHGALLITDGKWHHLVATRREETGKIFLNGVEKASGGGFSDTTEPPTDFIIGAYNLGNSGRLGGSISDLRIYSRALTSEEIQTIYTETKNKYITEEL